MNEEEIGGSNTDRKKYRRVFVRPDYEKSVWWLMLVRGDCKRPGTREYKLFRRRFGVGFERYKNFVEEARTWDITKEKDAIGRSSKQPTSTPPSLSPTSSSTKHPTHRPT